MSNPRPNTFSGGAGMKPKQAQVGGLFNISGSPNNPGKTVAQPSPIMAAMMNKKRQTSFVKKP